MSVCSNGFEFLPLIFASGLGLDAEFNSASNGDIFKGAHRTKNGGLPRNIMGLGPPFQSDPC